MEEELLNVVNKIENYNCVLNELHDFYGEDISEIVKSLLYKYCITSYDSASEKNKILNRVGFFLNFEFYGFFDKFNLDKDKLTTGLKPVKYISLQDIDMVIRNDYTTEYGRCYKHNFLNIIEYLHLIIMVIKRYVDRINKSLDTNSDNSILTGYNQFDLKQFNTLLVKVQSFRDEVILNVINALNINSDTKESIIRLIKEANNYRLTEEDIAILYKYIPLEDNEDDIVNEIVNNIYSYKQVDTSVLKNNKVKQYV